MKGKRHAKVVELINKHNIETQEELAERRLRAYARGGWHLDSRCERTSLLQSSSFGN